MTHTWEHGWRLWVVVLAATILISMDAADIGTTARAAAPDEGDWRRAIVKIERPREGGLPAEVGSGFFVSPGGHILTAAHVLLESDEGDEIVRRRPLNVQLFGTSLSRSARVLAMNRFTDLALLKIKADGNTPFLPVGDSAGVRSGDLLTIIGHPVGRQDWNESAAIVDSITPQERIFLQATLFNGQSGGPALDEEGRVVGIASYREEAAQQSYLVPSNDASGLLAGYVASISQGAAVGSLVRESPNDVGGGAGGGPNDGGSDVNADAVLAELRENQSDWVICGDNYNLVDSQLAAQGTFTAYVGKSDWNNYAVDFDVLQLDNSADDLSVLIRRQSDTDYVGLQLSSERRCGSMWVIAKEGKVAELVNSSVEHDCTGHYRIEAENHKYKFFKDGSQMFVFNNNSFVNGGVGIKSSRGFGGSVTFTIENFKVFALE